MTDKTQALQRLLEAVEAGRVGQFRNLDSEFGHGNGIHAKRAYNGSLDAAKALHEAMLPGWEFKIGLTNAVVFLRTHKDNDPQHSGMSEVSARAWLLAIIRAVMAGER